MVEFDKLFEREIKEAKGNISIYIKSIDGKLDLEYGYKEEEMHVSASTIKLPIMLSVLDYMLKNNISPRKTLPVREEDILEDTEIYEYGETDATIEELISWMIMISDNTATNVLINYLGYDLINNYIKQELHLEKTFLSRLMLDEQAIREGRNNYTSQKDMYITFNKLFNYELLERKVSDFAIETLYKQRIQDCMLRYIYDDVKFANKTGSVKGITHDLGVMTISDKLIYIGVSVKSDDKLKNKRIIGRVGKKAYEYLKRAIDYSI